MIVINAHAHAQGNTDPGQMKMNGIRTNKLAAGYVGSVSYS